MDISHRKWLASGVRCQLSEIVDRLNRDIHRGSYQTERTAQLVYNSASQVACMIFNSPCMTPSGTYYLTF